MLYCPPDCLLPTGETIHFDFISGNTPTRGVDPGWVLGTRGTFPQTLRKQIVDIIIDNALTLVKSRLLAVWFNNETLTFACYLTHS